MSVKELFKSQLVVINVGAEIFKANLQKQNVKTVQVNWRPPAGGDKKLAALLEKLK